MAGGRRIQRQNMLLIAWMWILLTTTPICCIAAAKWERPANESDAPSVALSWTINNSSWDKSHLDINKHHILDSTLNLNWLEFLRDKRIYLIGDSLTRFQFMELIFFLHFFHWEPTIPNLMSLSDKGCVRCDLSKYFHVIDRRFGCQLLSDAYRNAAIKGIIGHRENRYYYHFELNLTITNIFYGAPPIYLGFQDTPTVDTFVEECAGNHTHANTSGQEYVRSYDHVHEFILAEVAPQQPDVVFFNEGIWRRPREREDMQLIANALHRATRHVVWKTTTAHQHHKLPRRIDDPQFLDMLRELGFKIYDTYSVTHGITSHPEAFIDALHYTPFVYKQLNIVLLDFLKALLAPDSANS